MFFSRKLPANPRRKTLADAIAHAQTPRRLLSRRDALAMIGGTGAAAMLVACGDGGGATTTTTGTTTAASSTTSTGTTSTGTTSTGTTSTGTTSTGTTSSGSTSSGTTSSGTTTSTTGSCTREAEETNGPFPADGTNTSNGTTANVLTNNSVFRTDIRSDFDGTDTQAGTPLTLTMTVLNTNGSCAPLAGYYIYVWHANAAGHYSVYNSTLNGGDYSAYTFLRGIAKTDANGVVTFTTIFPARYSGRATHIHYEVYPDATPQHSEVKATSQLAFPDALTFDYTNGPYANTTLYPSSQSNNTTNSQDNVFSDGTTTELLTVTGSNAAGYKASITVSVAA